MNPLAHGLCAGLPELAEMLAAQLHELHKDPTPERSDRMAVQLAQAQTHIRRLSTELLHGDPPTV